MWNERKGAGSQNNTIKMKGGNEGLLKKTTLRDEKKIWSIWMEKHERQIFVYFR